MTYNATYVLAAKSNHEAINEGRRWVQSAHLSARFTGVDTPIAGAVLRDGDMLACVEPEERALDA